MIQCLELYIYKYDKLILDIIYTKNYKANITNEGLEGLESLEGIEGLESIEDLNNTYLIKNIYKSNTTININTNKRKNYINISNKILTKNYKRDYRYITFDGYCYKYKYKFNIYNI